MSEPIKVWVTKYALTSGMYETEVNFIKDGVVCQKGNYVKHTYDQYYYGKDWHQARESAVVRANEMRDRKIKSLEKQIEKLKGMVF